jgi:hypothetical protein
MNLKTLEKEGISINTKNNNNKDDDDAAGGRKGKINK